MDKLETPEDLENFFLDVKSQHIDEPLLSRKEPPLNEFFQKRKFSEHLLGWDKSRYEDAAKSFNDRLSKLPERITVSPQIAYLLLCDDEDIYIKSVDAQCKAYKGAARNAISPIYAALFPSPHSLFSAGMSFVNLRKKGKELQETLSRIAANHNEISATIMQNYQLCETDGGEYELKRGRWHVTESTELVGETAVTAYDIEKTGCHVSNKLDIEKLESLLEPQLIASRGRSA